MHSILIPNDVSKRAPNTLSILSLGSLFPMGDVVIASDSNDISMLPEGGSTLSATKDRRKHNIKLNDVIHECQCFSLLHHYYLVPQCYLKNSNQYEYLALLNKAG